MVFAVVDVHLHFVLGQRLQLAVDLAVDLGAEADELIGALLVAVLLSAVRMGAVDPFLLVTEELAGVDAPYRSRVVVSFL